VGKMKEFDWDEFDRGVFLVNVLAIIHNPKTNQILIGRRKEDPYIKKINWCFPGGRPAYDDELEDYLKPEVKKKTNLTIDVKEIIFARTVTENRRFLLIYFLAIPKNVGKEKAGEKFVEIKWVKPTEVRKYFTTSIHPRILKFLKKL